MIYKILPAPPPPPPPPDTITLAVNGYAIEGDLTVGDLYVAVDGRGIRVVRGWGEVPGVNGGTARIAFDVKRFFGLPIYFGHITVDDRGADSYTKATILFGSVRGSQNRATGSLPYIDFQRFPWRFGRLSFVVADNG